MATSLFQSSGDLTADRRYAFARDLAERGDFTAAADLLAQTVELTLGFAAGWFALGEMHERLGQQMQAVAAFRQVLSHNASDPYGASLHLVRLGAADVGNMPAVYVREVFDQYATRFDNALTQGLAYRGPELLFTAVREAFGRSAMPFRFGALLDLGCGSGLGAMPFRPFTGWLAGVDLSPNMVERARSKGIYDRLAVGGILEFLAGESADMHYHIVLAADVFIYFADLHPVIAESAKKLAPSGLLAFTVETHGGDGIFLGEKLRYAHGASHVRQACEAAGLDLVSLQNASIRDEAGIPVPGLVAVARRTGENQM